MTSPPARSVLGMPRRHARRREVPAWVAGSAVTAATGASLLLGFIYLDRRSLWLDEGYTWLTSDQRLGTIVSISRQQGWHLLPYYLVVHTSMLLFGDSATVLRAPSVIAGAMSVPLLYALVRRVGGRLAGIYAVLLFVISESLVFWQQNARDYTFVILLSVASNLALVAALQNDKVGTAVLWAVVTGVGAYTHPEVLFLLPPQLLVVLLWARTIRTRVVVFGLAAAGAILSLPVLALAAHGGVYQVSFLPAPNYGTATEIASFLASAAVSAQPVTPLNHALLGVTFAVVVLAVAVLAADLVEGGCRPANLGLGLGLGWLVLPVLIDWLASETGHPAFLDRYVILSLPATAVVVALVAARLEPRALGMWLVAYLMIFHAGLLTRSYGHPIDDYRGATTAILASARPGDCITFSANNGRMLYDYYLDHLGRNRLAPAQELPAARNGSPAVVLAYNDIPLNLTYGFQSPIYLDQVEPYCQRFFVLASHFGAPTGPTNQRALYITYQHLLATLNTGYRQVAQQHFAGVTVSLWDRAT